MGCHGEGITDAVWLPLACDPQIHGKAEVPKQLDLAFVGNNCPGERERLLEEIQKRYPNSFIGRRTHLEMAQIYSASRLVFNRSVKNDVNMRVFEAVCSGSLLITNDLSDNGLSQLFQDGVHLATYSCDEELFDKIAYYLKHDEVRERIANQDTAGSGDAYVSSSHGVAGKDRSRKAADSAQDATHPE